MNEKTAMQIARMKEQTIGVEVEMNNITRQKAAKVAAAYFGTGRYENTARRNGYSTYFGATYEFLDDDHTCEGAIGLRAASEVEFEDDGHAIAWAMQQ